MREIICPQELKIFLALPGKRGNSLHVLTPHHPSPLSLQYTEAVKPPASPRAGALDFHTTASMEDHKCLDSVLYRLSERIKLR